jgi:hypothetical protein
MTYANNVDDIRRTLTMASHMDGVRAARAAWPARDHATAASADVLAAQRRLQAIVRSAVGGGQIEERLDEALRQHEVALRACADIASKEAIARSGAEGQRLHALTAARVRALGDLAATPVAGARPARVFLDRPFLIWPTRGVFFADSAVLAAGSWAKFRVDSSRSSGSEEMSFYFLWDNPSSGYAVIDVDAFLVLNGHGRAGSDGGVFPSLSGRYSNLQIHARLYLLEWWNQPPTQPFPQADTTRLALALSTNTGGWGSVGAIESASVFRGFDLRHTQMLVPPGGVVVFEVAAGVGYSTSDGSINVDFESGSFEVMAPGVIVTVLT